MSNEKIILLSGDLVCLLGCSLPWYLAVSKTTSKQKQREILPETKFILAFQLKRHQTVHLKEKPFS